MGSLTAKTLREAERSFPGDAFYGSIATISVDRYWAKVVESGWVAGMPPHHAEQIHDELRRVLPSAPERAMLCLSPFALARNNFAESYTRLLERLRDESWGTFLPGHPAETDEEEGGGTGVSFTFMGRVYSALLVPGPVTDTKIFKLVNRALRDAGSDRQFASVPLGVLQDDELHLAFVGEKAFYHAEELGLFPSTDDDPFFR